MEISENIEIFVNFKQSWCLNDQSWSENPTLREYTCNIYAFYLNNVYLSCINKLNISTIKSNNNSI